MSQTLMSQVLTILGTHPGQWRAVAVLSGVPLKTLEKIARGETRNPRVRTVEAILRVLPERAR